MVARPIVTGLVESASGLLQVDWDIDWREQSAGVTNAGVTALAFAGFPRWVGTVPVHVARARIGQVRAVRAAARGRAGIYRVAMADPAVFPVACAPGGRSFSSGVVFSNGQGWSVPPYALAAGGWAKGATEIRVDVSSCAGVAPKVGQIMSHDDWPFVVTDVAAVGGDVYALGVEMPLRAAIADGDTVLMRGVGRFSLVDARRARLAYGPGLHSEIGLSFEEVLAR